MLIKVLQRAVVSSSGVFLVVLFGGMVGWGCARQPGPDASKPGTTSQLDFFQPGASQPDIPQPMSPGVARFLRLGTEALQRHEFERALAFADSASRLSPGLADIPFLRGRIYAELLRLDEAEAAYRQALAIRPTYPGGWHNLGNVAFRQQQYREAIRHYRREFDVHPDPRPWREIARSWVELGEADSARHAYGQALALDDTYASAHFGLALLLEDVGDFDGALSAVWRALDQEPDNPEYRYYAGAFLVRLDRWEEALDYLAAVIEHWPWHQGAHYNMARASMRLGRVEEARMFQERAEALRTLQASISQRETAVRAYPDNPYAHARLGASLRRARRYDDAMHAYRVALYLAPDNLDFRNNVAILHLLRGDTLVAIQSLEAMVQVDTTNVHTWINLGSLYGMAGWPEDACRAWNAALRIDPEDERALRLLATLPASLAGGRGCP